MMAQLVYLLCAVTSATCAVLLFRGYLDNGMKLLLWTSLCFVGLASSNALLFVDLVLIPQVDLRAVRSGVALVAMAVLLFGLVWESR